MAPTRGVSSADCLVLQVIQREQNHRADPHRQGRFVDDELRGVQGMRRADLLVADPEKDEEAGHLLPVIGKVLAGHDRRHLDGRHHRCWPGV